jgi:hypothetical protein
MTDASLQALPRLREAIFADEYHGRKNPLNTGLARTQFWTMLLLQHAVIGRASLLTEFCPSVTDIRLPDDADQWDKDGMPQFVLLDLYRWKGNDNERHQVSTAQRGAARAGVFGPLRRRAGALHRAQRHQPAVLPGGGAAVLAARVQPGIRAHLPCAEQPAHCAAGRHALRLQHLPALA